MNYEVEELIDLFHFICFHIFPFWYDTVCRLIFQYFAFIFIFAFVNVIFLCSRDIHMISYEIQVNIAREIHH